MLLSVVELQTLAGAVTFPRAYDSGTVVGGDLNEATAKILK